MSNNAIIKNKLQEHHHLSAVTPSYYKMSFYSSRNVEILKWLISIAVCLTESTFSSVRFMQLILFYMCSNIRFVSCVIHNSLSTFGWWPVQESY